MVNPASHIQPPNFKDEEKGPNPPTIRGASPQDQRLGDVQLLVSYALNGVANGAGQIGKLLKYTPDAVELANKGFSQAVNGLGYATQKSANAIFQAAETVTDAVKKLPDLHPDEISLSGALQQAKKFIFSPSSTTTKPEQPDSADHSNMYLENESDDPWVVLTDPLEVDGKEDKSDE